MQSKSTFDISPFSPEMNLLLSCCRSTIAGHPSPGPGASSPDIPDTLDWNSFLRLTDYHQVSPLVYSSLLIPGPSGVPPDAAERLKSRFFKRRFQALRFMAETVRIVNACRADNIDIICLKGPVLALQLYGDFTLRQLMDIDFFVDYRDLKKIHPLLLHFGYVSKHPELFSSSLHRQVFTRSKHHFPYFHPKELFQVEFHFRLFKNPHVLPNSTLNAWAHPLPVFYADSELLTLDPIDNFIYLAVHGAIHQWRLLKWLTDIARVCLLPTVDWEKLFHRAQQWGLDRPVLQCLLLVNRLFAIPLPPAFPPSSPPIPVIKMTRLAFNIITAPPGSSKHGFLRASRERLYLLKLKKGFRYKLRYLRDLFYLDSHRNILRLPGFLFPLYILLNPFLWLYKNYLMKKIPRGKVGETITFICAPDRRRH